MTSSLTIDSNGYIRSQPHHVNHNITTDNIGWSTGGLLWYSRHEAPSVRSHFPNFTTPYPHRREFVNQPQASGAPHAFNLLGAWLQRADFASPLSRFGQLSGFALQFQRALLIVPALAAEPASDPGLHGHGGPDAVGIPEPLQLLLDDFTAETDTPRKYIFDVTSVGQRSSPWSYDSVKIEIKFLFECKLRFSLAQFTLRQTHRTICKYQGEVLSFLALRVINVKIPLQPHNTYDITQYGELDFS